MDLPYYPPQQIGPQTSDAVQSLMGLFLGGTNLDRFLSSCSELLNAPVCFLERSAFHQASPPNSANPLDPPLLQTLYQWADRQSSIGPASPQFTPSDALPLPAAFPYGCIHAPVTQKEQLLGHFFILGTETSLGDFALTLSATITDMLAALVGLSAFSEHNRGVPNLSVFYSLLTGNPVDPAFIKTIINQFSFTSERELHILVLGGTDLSESQLKTLRDSCSSLISCSMQVIYQGYAVFLYHGRPKYPLSENHNFLSFLMDHHVGCGISNICPDYSEIPHYFDQAKAAFILGRGLAPEKCLFFYDEYALFHALSLASRFISAENLLSPKMHALIQYDQKTGTPLLETLQVYLRYINNLNRASELLNIHRNTLAYRLRKIEDITGWDFDSGDDLAHITFNLQVLRFVQDL